MHSSRTSIPLTSFLVLFQIFIWSFFTYSAVKQWWGMGPKDPSTYILPFIPFKPPAGRPSANCQVQMTTSPHSSTSAALIVPLLRHEHLSHTWPPHWLATISSGRRPSLLRLARWHNAQTYLRLNPCPYPHRSCIPCHRTFPHFRNIGRRQSSPSPTRGFPDWNPGRTPRP